MKLPFLEHSLRSRATYLVVLVALILLIFTWLMARSIIADIAPSQRGISAGTAPAGTVYLSPDARAADASAPAAKPEVHIANNGLILLRGARVVSISGTTLRVELAWDSGSFDWTVQTGYATVFFDSAGARQSLSDIQIGSTISVTGHLSQGGAEPILSATYVRS